MTTSAMALPARQVDDTASKPAPSGAAPKDQNRAGWLFAAPFLTLYILFLIGPVVIGLFISLFNTTTVRSGLGDFVGLSNYGDVLTNADFWASMWHSVLFTLLTTPLLVLIPLLFAILASRMARGQSFYRLAFFAPWAVPSSAVCLIFAF